MTNEVLEFIIVPPFDDREKVSAGKDRLEAHLARKFPGYRFKVSGFVPVGNDDDFAILPLMNYLDDQGKSRMCAPPKRWFLGEIAEECRAFNDGRAKSFAA